MVSDLRLSIMLDSFLDLRLAYGDSLDLCHERGAKSVSFTEIDPLFFTYNA